MGGGQARSPISSFITLPTTTSPSSPLFCRCLQLPANLPLILAQFLINMLPPPPPPTPRLSLWKSDREWTHSSHILLRCAIKQCSDLLISVWYCNPRGEWGVSHGDRCRVPRGISFIMNFLGERRVPRTSQFNTDTKIERVLLRDRDAAQLPSGAWLWPYANELLPNLLCESSRDVTTWPQKKKKF